MGRATRVVVGAALWAASATPGSQAQQPAGSLAGRVVSTVASEAPWPLSGVTVRLAEFGLAVETDEEGRFDLGLLPTGRYQVSAEILGCQLGVETVAVTSGVAATVGFAIDRPVIAIPGLVATGRPEAFEPPYTVGRVDRDRLERSPAHTIADLIRGAFPSAKIVQGSGLAGSTISIQLRGRRSIATRQEPLIVVDGFITGGGSIDISPRDVDDIVVLKGSGATAHYGARGQAGVIEITTRQGRSRAEGRTGPWVIVDGSLTTKGLDELDARDIAKMELVGAEVARSLFGGTAPDEGVVAVTTRASTAEAPLKSCFEAVAPIGPPRSGGPARP